MLRVRKLSFDRFVLDPANARLTLDGNAVPITPKVFELLCCFVGRAGQLVTKDQLLDAVWPRRYVSESVLKDHISDLRQALGDQVQAPRFIETVTRHGYRFIATVKQLTDADAANGRSVAVALAISPSSEAGRAPLVGRASTLETLERHWRRALAGERQVVFLCGEAGIGKTALIDLFLDRAATQ